MSGTDLLNKSAALLLLAALGLIAGGVWWFQNRGERLGGRISAIKAAWLAYAIVLWFGVPIALWNADGAFVWLAVSMLARAAFEIPLCLGGWWRVRYGVGHDLVHALLVIFLIDRLGIWGVLTLLALATELLFVRWFLSATGGPREGVFFVPGGARFRLINRRTAWLFLPQAAMFIGLLSHRVLS
jgi:hypothetical protein